MVRYTALSTVATTALVWWALATDHAALFPLAANAATVLVLWGVNSNRRVLLEDAFTAGYRAGRCDAKIEQEELAEQSGWYLRDGTEG